MQFCTIAFDINLFFFFLPAFCHTLFFTVLADWPVLKITWSDLWVLVCLCGSDRIAANGSGSLVFTDEVTVDRNSRMNSDVYVCSYSAKCYKMIGCFFTVQTASDPKHTAKVTRDFQGNENEYSSVAKSLTWSQPNWAWFLRQNWRQKDSQTSSTEGGYSNKSA